MIRVDPSPIVFYFYYLFDPSWSELIRVDPTRTGGPSWSGPTFVPAYWIEPKPSKKMIINYYDHFFLQGFGSIQCIAQKEKMIERFNVPNIWTNLLFYEKYNLQCSTWSSFHVN